MLDFLSPRKLLTQLTLGAGLVAAQLQTITNFGPTYSTQLQMQAYIPNNLPSNPAVILAVSNPQKLSGLETNPLLSCTLAVAADQAISSRPSTGPSPTLAARSLSSLRPPRISTAGMSPVLRPSSTTARVTARFWSAWSTMSSSDTTPTATRSSLLEPAPDA